MTNTLAESERMRQYQKPEGVTVNMSLAHPLRGLHDIIAGDNTLPTLHSLPS